jgi:hypothetical protein
MKLICMTFDGDHVVDGDYDTVEEAEQASCDMGSRWYFYPYHFILSDSGKTVKTAGENLERFVGKRLSTVKKEFKMFSELPEARGLDCEEFGWLIC